MLAHFSCKLINKLESNKTVSEDFMKKMIKIRKLFFLAIVVLAVITGSTCKNNIALGNAVDINRPEVTVDTNKIPMTAIIRNSFTLEGSCSDDVKLNSVTVHLYSKAMGMIPLKNASINESANKWSIVLNRKNSEGKFPLKDGNYEVEITATDASGKKTSIKTAFAIDNTPPILVLDRPSSLIIPNPATPYTPENKPKADVFGNTFKIIGECADSTPTLSKMRVYGRNKSGSKTAEYWEENVPSSISLKIDSFYGAKTAVHKRFYKEIYYYTTGGSPAKDIPTKENQEFYLNIELFDRAKEYNSPDTDGNPNDGNKTTVYYLRDPLYNLVFSKYPASDVYKMFNGSFSGNEADKNKIINALETGVYTDTEPFKVEHYDTYKDNKNIGYFALNPSLEPKFSIMGSTPLTKTKLNEQLTEYATDPEKVPFADDKRALKSKILVKLSPNYGQTPLDKANGFKFFFMPLQDYKWAFLDGHYANHTNFDINEETNRTDLCSHTYTPTGASAAKNVELIEIDPEDGGAGASPSYTLNLSDDKFNANEAYVLMVAGKDKDGNTFLPDRQNVSGEESIVYGFFIPKSGNKPVVTLKYLDNCITSINDVGDCFKSPLKLEVNVKDSDNTGSTTHIHLKVEVGSYVFDEDITTGASNTEGTKTLEIPLANFVKGSPAVEKDGPYNIKLTATGLVGDTIEKYRVIKDTTGPTFRIEQILNKVSSMPEVKGQVSDNQSGFDKSKLKVKFSRIKEAPASPEVISGVSFKYIEESGDWNLSGLPTEEGKYRIDFSDIKDKLGNTSGDKNKTFIYDKAAPKILNINDLEPSKTEKVGIEEDNQNVNITGRIKESHGIKQLFVNGLAVTPTKVAGTADEYEFTKAITLTEGEHLIPVKVIDKADYEDILKLKVVVDTNKPTFKGLKIAGFALAPSSSDPSLLVNNANDDGDGDNDVLTVGSEVIELLGTFVDTGSGVKNITVKKKNGSDWNLVKKINASYAYDKADSSTKNDYSVDGSGSIGLGKSTIKIIVTDYFDKKSEWTVVINVVPTKLTLIMNSVADDDFIVIDDVLHAKSTFKIQPESSVQGSTAPPLTLTVSKKDAANKDVLVALDSVFESIVYKKKNAGGTYVSISDSSVKSDTVTNGTITGMVAKELYEIEFTPKSTAEDGRYIFELSGNGEKVKTIVVIDKKAPTVTPVYPAAGVELHDGDKLKVAFSDISGVKNDTAKVHIQKVGGTEEIRTLAIDSDGVYYYDLDEDADLGDEGKYQVWFTIDDGVGNHAAENKITVFYDKELPDLELKLKKAGEIDYIERNELRVNANFDVKAIATDSNGIETIKLEIKKDGATAFTAIPPNSGTTDEFTVNVTKDPFAGDGEYVLHLTAIDKANKPIMKECKIDLDTEKPAVTAPSTVEWQTKQTYQVSVEANDVPKDGFETGVNLVECRVGESGDWTALTFDQDDNHYKAYVDLEKGENTIYYRATDRAGNTSSDTDVKNIVKLDISKPSLERTSPTGSLTSIGKAKDLVIEYTVTDDTDGADKNSGFDDDPTKIVTVTLNGESYTDASVVDKTAGKYKISIPDSVIASLDEKNYDVKLVAVDKVGNKSETYSFILKKDYKNPGISILNPEATASVYHYADPSSPTAAEILANKATKDWAKNEYLALSNITIQGKIDDDGGSGLLPTSDAKVMGVEYDVAGGGKITYPYADCDYACKIGKDGSALNTDDEFKMSGATGWAVIFEDVTEYCKLDPSITEPTPIYADKMYNSDGSAYEYDASKPDLKPKVFRVPITIKATDEAGNVQEQKFYIMVDADGRTPKVNILTPPIDNGAGGTIVLGGNVSFSGTAQTNNPIAGSVTAIQACFSESNAVNGDGTFTNSFSAEWNDGSTTSTYDWKDGQTVYRKSKINSWNFVIEADKFLNGATEKTLYYRLRGVNSRGDEGPWTEVRKIELNSTAPTLQNVKIKEKGAAASATGEGYISGYEVKDGDTLEMDFIGEKGISRIQIVSDTLGWKDAYVYDGSKTLVDLNTATDNITNITIGGQKIFTEIDESGRKGYHLSLPILAKNLKDPDQKIAIKITITDNKDDDKISNFTQFDLVYDTAVPVVVFGKPAGDFAKASFSSESAVDIKYKLRDGETGAALASDPNASDINTDNLYVFAQALDDDGKLTSAKSFKVKTIVKTSFDDESEKKIFAKITYSPLATTGVHVPINQNIVYVLYRKNNLICDRISDQLEGITYDKGTGVSSVKFDLTDSKSTPTELTGNTTDLYSKLGGFSLFQKTFETNTAKDGNASLKLIVKDNAKNSSEISESVYLRNHPLKIANVSFETDLNADTEFNTDSNEIVGLGGDESYYKKKGNDNNYIQESDLSKSFTFTNSAKSAIKFELSGNAFTGSDYASGNYENIKYTVYKIESDGTRTKIKGGEDTDKLSSDGVISFDTSDFTAIGQGNKKLCVVLTDTITDDTNRKLELIVDLKVNTVDKNNPQVTILPFYWNDEDSNSVASTFAIADTNGDSKIDENDTHYADGRKTGHIEIEETADDTGKSQVSGRIVLRGTAYHSSRLQSLTLTVPKNSGNNTFSANYTNGKWKSVANGSEKSLLRVKDARLDNNGHWVTWEYVWNTPDPATSAKEIKISATAPTAGATNPSSADIASGKMTVAKKAVANSDGERESTQSLELNSDDVGKAKVGQFIRLVDGDKSYLCSISKISDDGKTVEWKGVLVDTKIVDYYLYSIAYSSTSPVYNMPKRDIKIVPYVTALKRADKYNTHRSTSGAYSLLRGDSVTIEGFNLNGTVKASVGKSTDTTTNFTLLGTAKSGKITITANGVIAINNSTNNSKPYNQQVVKNNEESKYWTDDIAIDVWKDNESFPGSANPMYPAMAKGSDDSLFASFSNYSKASVYYSKLGSTKASEVFHGYDPTEETAICVAGVDTIDVLYSANYHGGHSYDWNTTVGDAGGIYCYDKNAASLDAGRGSYKIHRFELFYHDRQLQQFKNFRVARKGVSDTDRIHICYYDTLSHSIKYSNRQSNNEGDSSHETRWVNLDGGSDADDQIVTSYYTEKVVETGRVEMSFDSTVGSITLKKNLVYDRRFYKISISGTTSSSTSYGPYDIIEVSGKQIKFESKSSSWSNNKNRYYKLILKRPKTVDSFVLPNANFETAVSRTSGTSEYSAIALDTKKRPVVVYADVDSGTLRLARASNANPMSASDWHVQKVLADDDINASFAADYFTAKFDSSGYLHIAFRNTKGQLCYVKSNNKNTGASVSAYTFDKSVKVDDYGALADLTLNGSVPYISYMAKTNAYDGIRVAYYDANLVKSWNADGGENEKGAWCVMTAAMQNRANNVRTCIAVSTQSTTKWNIAVGYTPGSTYNTVKYIGK